MREEGARLPGSGTFVQPSVKSSHKIQETEEVESEGQTFTLSEKGRAGGAFSSDQFKSNAFWWVGLPHGALIYLNRSLIYF